MKHKTYTLSSHLSPEGAIAQVEKLLGEQGVQYKTEGLSICSTRTPVALLGLQRTLYSAKNWVGLNPFTFISGVDVLCRLDESGRTSIVVHVKRFRTFLWVAFWVWVSALAASAMPAPEGASLFIAITLTAWFVLVVFFSGYLIKKEIADCLNA